MKLAGRIFAVTGLLAFAAGAASAQMCSAISLLPSTLPSATFNTPYSTSLNGLTQGGAPPYSYSSAVLPPGLTMDATGAISGTPTKVTHGAFTGSVTVTDSCSPPQTVSLPLSIQVFAQALTITTSTLPAGIQGVAYSQTIQVTGGVPPYSFAVFGNNALASAGLTLNPSSGVISGSPTAGGQFPFKIQVTDSQKTSAFQSFSLQIESPLAIATAPALHFGLTGQSYAAQFTTQPGTGGPNVTWSAPSSTLPAGLTLESTGLLHGTPSTPGAYSFTVHASDGFSSASENATISIHGPLAITTPALPNGTYEQTYGPVTLTATGGSGNFVWSASGLPDGVAVNGNHIQGTPTAAGQFPVTLMVRDTDTGQSASNPSYSTTIAFSSLVISTAASLGGVSAGGAFSTTLGVTGGLGPYKWSAGSLPAGFAITAGGTLSGTSSAGGNLSLTVQVTDSEPQPVTVSKTFALNVLGLVPATLAAGTTAAPYVQTFSAVGGSLPYTFSATGLPTGLTLSSSGATSGTSQQTGTFLVTVKVTDSGGITASNVYSVTILVPLAISSSAALPFGIVNQPYSQALATQVGTGGTSVIWSSPASMPAGLTLDKTGLLHGTPISAGTFSIPITANDGVSPAAVLNASLTIYGPITITTSSLPSAQYQQTYAPVTMVANGGSGNFTWSATGLPSGLTINTGGVISGSPTAAGTFPVTVALTDNISSQTASQNYSLTVGYSTLSVTPQSPIGVAVGGSVSANLVATGGLTPYKWAPVGSLPAGFALTAAGALTGTPLQPGNLTIQVQVTDSEPQPATVPLTVNVNVLGFTTSSPLPSGLTTATYSQALAATGGTPPYTFSASGLPAGLALTGSGALNGAMKNPGTFSFTAQVADSGGITATATYGLTISGPGPLIVTSPTLANGTANVLYSASLSTAAAGGKPPYQWSVQAGTLPAGVTLSATGVVAGTPTVPGTYSFTVQATDGAGASASAPASLVIIPAQLGISTQSPLPSGIVGIAYPQQILTATGGVPPYQFTLTPGQQPDPLAQSGLSLSNGLISGTPTSSGNFTVGITVTDNAGKQAQTSLSLNIRPASADIVLSTGTLSFTLSAGSEALPSSQYISVGSSDGTQVLGFTTLTSSAAGWLTVSGGASTPTSLIVRLNSQASALAPSTTPYTATITVACASTQCSASDTPQTVTVSLLVTATPGSLNVETDLLSFSVTSSPPTASTQPLSIQNSGGESLGITSISCEATWCHVGSYPSSLNAGVTIAIPITADPTGLPANYYRTTVDIVTSGGVASVPVTLLLAQSAQVVLAPSGAQMQMPQGGTLGNPSGSFLVTVSGTATINWTATLLPAPVSPPAWLTLNTPSGTASGNAPGTVSFSINQAAASALTAQAYYATIEITAPGVVNSPQDFQLVFNVAPPANPLVPDPQPAGLIFITQAGVAPPPQTVQVFASSSGSIGYTASASANDGGTWLSVNTSAGTTSGGTPTPTQVSVNPASLGPGVYYGGVNYAFTTNPAAIRTVNVTLIVQPTIAAPSISRQTGVAHGNASAQAGCSSSSLAPAPTGLVNNFSAPASWPTPISIQLYDNCGNAVSAGQIVVSFNNGDPPLALGLANSSTGLYSGTWTPRNVGTQVSLNARATATGFAAASVQLTGSVVPNIAPVLNKGGTLHVFNPQIGAAMAPGTIVQIYGSGLASGIASAQSIPLPTSLNGTSVIIGGKQAPLYFVSPGQINAQIPFDLDPSSPYQIVASANGALTTPLTIQLAPQTPGFAAFADGGLIAQHGADLSLITQSSPARPGEFVVAYLAGMGGTTIPVQTGGPSPLSPLAYTSVKPTLTLNGTAVPVTFSGMTPGLVGLYQLDFQIPTDAANGTITVVLSQGSFASNATTLPVQQ